MSKKAPFLRRHKTLSAAPAQNKIFSSPFDRIWLTSAAIGREVAMGTSPSTAIGPETWTGTVSRRAKGTYRHQKERSAFWSLSLVDMFSFFFLAGWGQSCFGYGRYLLFVRYKLGVLDVLEIEGLKGTGEFLMAFYSWGVLFEKIQHSKEFQISVYKNTKIHAQEVLLVSKKSCVFFSPSAA